MNNHKANIQITLVRKEDGGVDLTLVNGQDITHAWFRISEYKTPEGVSEAVKEFINERTQL